MTTATESRPPIETSAGGGRVPLSILDLATVSEGSTGAEATPGARWCSANQMRL